MRQFPVLWLLAFWLGSAGSAYCQAHLIDLPAQRLVLPQGVYITKIVDARPSRASIGTMRLGAGNVRVSANLRNGLEYQLMAALPPLPAQVPAHRQLWLRIHRLEIREKTGAFGEKAHAAVEVDYLWQQGDSYYVIGTDADSVVTNAAIDVTDQHPANVVAALQKCLARLEAVDWSRLPGDARAISAGEVNQIVGGKRLAWEYAVQRDSVLRPGVYHSFVQFRNNQPDASLPLSIIRVPRVQKEWQGTEEIRPLLGFAPNEQPLQNVWGFSDGKAAYIAFRNKYYPLVRTSQGFSFEGLGLADPGAVSTAGALGGALGAAIATASTSGHRTQYYVNMLTGSVSSSPHAEDRIVADTAMVIILPAKGKADVLPVEITVNGERQKLLGPDDMLPIAWTDKTRELQICALGNCLTFIPVFGQPIYLRCAQNPQDKSKPPFVRLPAKEGLFEIRRSQLRQQAQAKRSQDAGR